MIKSIFAALAEFENNNLPVALCTVVKSSGSTPRHAASKMLVYPDGQILGSVGGGKLETEIIKEALSLLQEGKSRLLEYSMADPERGDVGVCGGQVEVFVESILPAPLLVIVGGGHVGKAVAHLAKWLGFRVAISDDRAEFCTPEANPDADEFYACPLADLPGKMVITPRTFFVLTTRGVTVDVPGLPGLINSPAAYVGIIGSRRRWSTTKKELINRGVSDEKLACIHSPIGMGIGAETPEEIAVSIMAEVVMIKNGGTGRSMKEPR